MSAPDTPPPEADLALRASPAPVVRLSRRALVLISGLSAAAILGAAAFAMTRHRVAEAPPSVSLAGPPPDALRALPSDYKVPHLGPPLPGDLGGPILAAQARFRDARASAPAQTPSPTPVFTPPASSDLDRQRDAERDAARRSGLLLTSGRGPAGHAPPCLARPNLAGALPATTDVAQAAPTPGSAGPASVNPARLTDPPSPYVLQAGALIPAALITGVRSDLPGQVVAQVSEPVYDTLTGRVVLIPQGARLLGTYDDRIAFGQRRVHLVWTRLILPNGRSLALGQAPAGDAAGYAGLQDRVDRRWGALFGMAALSTVLSFGAELGAGSDSDLVRALRRGAGETFNDVGQQAVGKALAIAPALTLRPGTPVRLIVTQDLVLEPFQETRP